MLGQSRNSTELSLSALDLSHEEKFFRAVKFQLSKRKRSNRHVMPQLQPNASYLPIRDKQTIEKLTKIKEKNKNNHSESTQPFKSVLGNNSSLYGVSQMSNESSKGTINQHKILRNRNDSSNVSIKRFSAMHSTQEFKPVVEDAEDEYCFNAFLSLQSNESSNKQLNNNNSDYFNHQKQFKNGGQQKIKNNNNDCLFSNQNQNTDLNFIFMVKKPQETTQNNDSFQDKNNLRINTVFPQNFIETTGTKSARHPPNLAIERNKSKDNLSARIHYYPTEILPRNRYHNFANKEIYPESKNNKLFQNSNLKQDNFENLRVITNTTGNANAVPKIQIRKNQEINEITYEKIPTIPTIQLQKRKQTTKQQYLSSNNSCACNNNDSPQDSIVALNNQTNKCENIRKDLSYKNDDKNRGTKQLEECFGSRKQAMHDIAGKETDRKKQKLRDRIDKVMNFSLVDRLSNIVKQVKKPIELKAPSILKLPIVIEKQQQSVKDTPQRSADESKKKQVHFRVESQHEFIATNFPFASTNKNK